MIYKETISIYVIDFLLFVYLLILSISFRFTGFPFRLLVNMEQVCVNEQKNKNLLNFQGKVNVKN